MTSIWRNLSNRALMLSALLMGACADSGAGGHVPVAVDWILDGSVPSLDVPFEVKEHQVYAIELRYPYQSGNLDERKRLWTQVGGDAKNPSTGQWEEPGAPVVVRVQVWRQSEEGGLQPIAERRIANPRLTSWGGDRLNAELLRLDLIPGRYAVQAHLLKAAPTLSGVVVKLAVNRAYFGK